MGKICSAKDLPSCDPEREWGEEGWIGLQVLAAEEKGCLLTDSCEEENRIAKVSDDENTDGDLRC